MSRIPGTYTIDLNFTDGMQHQLAVYNLDWEGAGRAQTLSLLDGSTNAVLDSRNMSAFQGGQYLVWTLRGHVVLQVTYTGGNNAVVSGLFFDPASGGGGGSDYVTTYSYDILAHLTGVSMTRATGTQTRTFNYINPSTGLPGALLRSATNPENGTVSYGYDTQMRLISRVDAKGQQVQYGYDAYSRRTQVRRYPNGVTEDTCQQENYYYDSNPFDASFSTNPMGRLTAVQYKAATGLSGSCDTTFTEMFGYSTQGAGVSQRLRIARPSLAYTDLNAFYQYDIEGRVTGLQYPSWWNGSTTTAGPHVGYSFDTMGRPIKLTDLVANTDMISNASYGSAGQLTDFWGPQFSESYSYNSLLQKTRVANYTVNKLYNYPATGNNGKIVSEHDNNTLEDVNYTYDSLNRLASAYTSDNASVAQWGQSFTYDGFGNLTDQNLIKGTAPQMHVAYNAATNRQTGDTADANGNITNFNGVTSVYDVENRLQSTNYSGTVRYGYSPQNKRVWRGVWNQSTFALITDEVTFWAGGQRLATYNLGSSGGSVTVTQTGAWYYFSGKLVKNPQGWVNADRLGSVGKYYPYGWERPSGTANGMRDVFPG